MCDITNPLPETESQRLDRELKEYDEDWFAVARYRVVRSQFDPLAHKKSRKVLATGLPYPAAKKLQTEEAERITREPGYRSGCMGNPIPLVELENTETANTEFKVLRAAREERNQQVLRKAA